MDDGKAGRVGPKVFYMVGERVFEDLGDAVEFVELGNVVRVMKLVVAEEAWATLAHVESESEVLTFEDRVFAAREDAEAAAADALRRASGLRSVN